jgi:hypothetical protein
MSASTALKYWANKVSELSQNMCCDPELQQYKGINFPNEKQAAYLSDAITRLAVVHAMLDVASRCGNDAK